MKFTEGQSVIWFRPPHSGGRGWHSNRIKTPATYLGPTRSGKRLKLLVRLNGQQAIINAPIEWVEAASAGSEEKLQND